MSGDDDDRERPKLSWREVDQLRGQKRRSDRREPRGAKAQARAKAATQQYLKQADKLFSDAPGGSSGAELADAVRAAQGTAEFEPACGRLLEALGPPQDLQLASLLLDAESPDVLKGGLAGLAALRDAGRLEVGRGLRTRLRILAEHPDDDIAYEAEGLLG